MVFQNANRGHNGTYSLHVSLMHGARGAKTVTSNISVIILGKELKFCANANASDNKLGLYYWIPLSIDYVLRRLRS